MRTPAFQIERKGRGNASKDGQRKYREVQSKKTLDLYAAVKKWLNEEKYVNDPGDRRGARLKFRFRTRSAGLRAEVGGWKNKEEAKQCVNSQLLYSQVSHNCRIIQYSAVYCMSYLQSFPFLFLWLFVADIFHLRAQWRGPLLSVWNTEISVIGIPGILPVGVICTMA